MTGNLSGNNLEMINEETGKAENVKFDWVPPNVEKSLASRYMSLIPVEKRPIAGTEVCMLADRLNSDSALNTLLLN